MNCGYIWRWYVIFAVNFQFKQLDKEAWKKNKLKKIRASTGFESCWSPDFFQASLFQLLKLEIHCEDHISPSYISAVHIWIISYNSQLTSLPMCGFIAQLVEHRTDIAEVTCSNPVEALIFFRLLYSNCLNWKFIAKITYHLHVFQLII